jgi:hypothetical protein
MNKIARIGFGCAVGLVAVTSAGKAGAGLRSAPNVTINTSTQTASGAMGTARRISGGQYISCDATGSTWDVHCVAQQPNGARVECTLPGVLPGYPPGTLPDDRQVTTIGAMNPDSYITFKYMTLSGVSGYTCGFIQIVNSSEYEPKPL